MFGVPDGVWHLSGDPNLALFAQHGESDPPTWADSQQFMAQRKIEQTISEDP